MHWPLPCLILSSFVALSSAAVPLSQQMADSVIARHTPLGLSATGAPLTTYEHGVFETALRLVFNKTGDTKYYDYLKWGLDNLINPSGRLLDYNFTDFTLDDLRLGPEFIYLYTATGDIKYRRAADTLRSQISSQPRGPSGGFWHRSTYPDQMWLDGIYMGQPFYTQYTAWFQPTNTTAYDDVVHQFALMFNHSVIAATGLMHHAWDESRKADWANPVTGQSPEVWGRAMGWYMMALVDTLDYLPATHASTLRSQLSALAPAIIAATDPASHLWWDVMSQPGRAGNYIESSCSSMFVAALLKGIRKGYIPASTFRAPLLQSYEALAKRFVVKLANGTLDWEGTVQVGEPGTYAEYLTVPLNENDLKGLGPFVYASIEYETATAGR